MYPDNFAPVFFAVVIDTGEEGTHNWKLYEWIVNP
jgi:hypothetical protein